MDKHPLAAWIEKNTSQAKFAADAGCSESHLSLILQRKRGISLPLAQKFSNATNGDVSVQDFVSTEAAQ